MSNITVREYSPQAFDKLSQSGMSPVLARIFAARGIEDSNQLEVELSRLIPFNQIKSISLMAGLLADAIAAKKRLLIVADYDSDGATACAVGIRILREFNAMVDYLVPNRFEYGYGLTPEIVRLAHDTKQPDMIITVDNGIASVDGVAEANRLGINVLITDHHLPGDELPDALAIINPNQPGCDFPSKNIAGVGVIFYLMLALLAELRTRGAFQPPAKEPNLANYLDLVALGTVADVVKLDDNNRILVQQGLQRIRKGRSCAGIKALLQIGRREARLISTYELGFILGPRLNAAGRLDDMALGIECLISDDETQATQMAQQLDHLNRERREIEAGMQDNALLMLESVFKSHDSNDEADAYSVCLFDESWHQGVIGILASRIKDKFHRPVITFAPGNDGEIKGSGRSIPGFHLRDALDLVYKKYPGMILKFGGHAAAAGLTINATDFEKFCDAFEQVATTLLSPSDLTRIIETDGDLETAEMNLELAQCLSDKVWGQGFPQPTFSALFSVENQRIVGEKHLKLKLKKADSIYDAILFFHHDPLPDMINAVYRLQANEYNGNTTLQLLIEHWTEPITQ